MQVGVHALMLSSSCELHAVMNLWTAAAPRHANAEHMSCRMDVFSSRFDKFHVGILGLECFYPGIFFKGFLLECRLLKSALESKEL